MDALNTERKRGMENCVTLDTIMLSTTHVNQRFEDITKAGSTDKRPPPGGIARSIAATHQLFEDLVKISEPMQEMFSDVAVLAPKIRIQKVAFEHGCKSLLATVAKSRQDVDNMFEDPCHPIWKDTIAHRNLDKVMARFYSLYSKALEHFQKSLTELKVELYTLRRQGKRKGNRRYHIWPKRSKSLTVSTTENLAGLVHDLRDYNDIICTLIWQAVPRQPGHMLGSSSAEDLGYPYPTGAARESHRHFACIQRASQILYTTLSHVWTCCNHEAHSLRISLNFDYVKPGAVARCKDVRFDVAVTSPYFDNLYGLVVDSAHCQYCTCQMGEEDQSSKMTHQGDKVAGSAAREISSDSSGHDAVVSRAGGQGTRTLMRPESMQNEVSDSVLKGEFFRSLRKSSATIESKQGTGCSCLEYLNSGGAPKFLFSYVLGCDSRERGSHSLDDVLVRANSECRAISVEDRLRTASSLAAGVLHLNSSSWLPQVWSSKDIYFFGKDGYERCALGEPFLQTQSDSNVSRGPVYGVKTSAFPRSVLVSLGLVLIELAFSAPWRRLQLQEGITKNLFDWERDPLNLMRLSETVSRELGSRYAKVVHTCLFQGSGAQETHGPGKSELDEVIFKDIVGELDICVSAVTLS